jgi:hypothetical protein
MFQMQGGRQPGGACVMYKSALSFMLLNRRRVVQVMVRPRVGGSYQLLRGRLMPTKAQCGDKSPVSVQEVHGRHRFERRSISQADRG